MSGYLDDVAVELPAHLLDGHLVLRLETGQEDMLRHILGLGSIKLHLTLSTTALGRSVGLIDNRLIIH